MKKKFLSVVAVVMACSMLFGCSTKKSANEAASGGLTLSDAG